MQDMFAYYAAPTKLIFAIMWKNELKIIKAFTN